MNERFDFGKAVIVTAADSGYFDLLMGMIRSVRRFEECRQIPIAVFDVGFTPEHRMMLEQDNMILVDPSWHFGRTEETSKSYERAALVRFFINDYLPGFDYSLWLDPDLWLQDPAVIRRMIDGARETGAAIAHESDALYRFQLWLWAWNLKHKIAGSGLWRGTVLMARQNYNLGLYCLASKAPHWDRWRQRFEAALRRTNRITPYEQFTFNEVIHIDKMPTTKLESTDNWICDRRPPMWDEQTSLFCRPAKPFKPLSILHLAGPAKSRTYEIELASGGMKTISLRYPWDDVECPASEQGRCATTEITPSDWSPEQLAS